LNNPQGFKKKDSRQQPRRVTVNLFIEEGIVNSLRQDAQDKRVSLNARINEIVSTQFAVFIELMDEEKTAEIMQTDGTATMLAYFQHNNIPITLDSIIEVAFANVSIASGVCTKFTQHIDEEGYRCLVFDHRYGIKWSRIIAKVFSYLLEKTCNVNISATLLPNTIALKIIDR
jgi:hypothetical protein